MRFWVKILRLRLVGEPEGLSVHPLRIHGDHNFLFFWSLSKVENLSTRKITVIFHVYYIKIKTAYMHLKIVLLGSDITHLKITPTFVLFGHVVRCFLQYLSLLSILCTSKYSLLSEKMWNTMFLQSAIVKCIFLSRISNPISICMELLLDYPLWNYKVESQCLTN